MSLVHLLEGKASKLEEVVSVVVSILISLPIGTNGTPLEAIETFPISTGKLMIGKISAANGEEITNAIW